MTNGSDDGDDDDDVMRSRIRTQYFYWGNCHIKHYIFFAENSVLTTDDLDLCSRVDPGR